jgi:integrase
LLNTYAVDVLKGVPKLKGNPFVFAGQVAGQHLINIAKPWLRIRKLAELPGLRLHDLRHSFGNRAIDAGGSTRVLGVLLGHADEDTTQRYAHVSDSRALQLVDETGRLIAQSMDLARPKRKFRFRRIRRSFTVGSSAVKRIARA